MDKKYLKNARKVCEGELALLHEQTETLKVKLQASTDRIQAFKDSGDTNTSDELQSESERVEKLLEDLSIKENEFKALLNDIDFVAERLYENTPVPPDSTFGHIIDEYGLVAEELETYRSNIVASLNAKGLTIPVNSKLSSVPEQILKLPTLGGDLTINPPNVGAMIDAKDREYDVTKITNEHVYSNPNEKTTLTWKIHNYYGPVYSIFVDKDGYIYNGITLNGVVRKLSPDGEEVWTFGITSPVLSVCVDKDGCVYSGSKDGVVRKLSPDGEEVWTFAGHTDWVYSVYVDNDGYVYSGSVDKTVRKISPNGEEVWTFNDYDGNVNSVFVDKDGCVYSGGQNSGVTKISPGGNLIWRFRGHTNTVLSVCVDKDSYVYSGGMDNTIKKISPDGEEIWTSTGYISNVYSVFVDNDGYVYSGSGDRTVKKLSPDGEEIWKFIDDNKLVRSVFVDNDGYVYSGGDSYDTIKTKDNYKLETTIEVEGRSV